MGLPGRPTSYRSRTHPIGILDVLPPSSPPATSDRITKRSEAYKNSKGQVGSRADEVEAAEKRERRVAGEAY